MDRLEPPRIGVSCRVFGRGKGGGRSECTTAGAGQNGGAGNEGTGGGVTGRSGEGGVEGSLVIAFEVLNGAGGMTTSTRDLVFVDGFATGGLFRGDTGFDSDCDSSEEITMTDLRLDRFVAGLDRKSSRSLSSLMTMGSTFFSDFLDLPLLLAATACVWFAWTSVWESLRSWLTVLPSSSRTMMSTATTGEDGFRTARWLGFGAAGLDFLFARARDCWFGDAPLRRRGVRGWRTGVLGSSSERIRFLLASASDLSDARVFFFPAARGDLTGDALVRLGLRSTSTRGFAGEMMITFTLFAGIRAGAISSDERSSDSS